MNKLFEPIQIGSMTLKNRIVMAPMGTTTDTTNAFNMRDVKYYGERAKGGCGLVLTGAVVASTEFEPAPCQKLTNTKDMKEAYPPMAVTTILTTAVGTAAVAIFMSLFPSLP